MVRITQQLPEQMALNAYRHLSHFAAINGDQALATSLWDYLVMQGLAQLSCATAAEIASFFANRLGLECDELEIQPILDRLVRQRKARRHLSHRNMVYRITDIHKETIRQEWRVSQQLEKTVLQAWSSEVQERHGLTSVETDDLLDDLKRFFTHLLRRNGADCVILLRDGTVEQARRLITSCQDDMLAALPERSARIMEVRSTELPLFFITADAYRISYFDQMTRAMFVLFAVSVDSDLSTMMRKNYAGGVVLLDTNLAYRLLGLGGPEIETAMAKLLKYSRALGYEPRISLRTVDELYKLVQTNIEDLLEPDTDPTVDEMRQHLNNPTLRQDIVKAYYRQVVHEYDESGRKLTRKAFALALDAPEKILEQKYGITIYEQYHDWIEAQTETLAAYTEACIEASAQRPEGKKSLTTAEHDAHNRLLIQRIRQEQHPRKYVDMNAWFITADRTLVVADQALRQPDELPCVMLAEPWMHMARLCTSRFEDPDGVFGRLLAEPYIRSFQLPTQIAETVGGYLAQSQVSPELATKLLQNRMLTEILQKLPLPQAAPVLDAAIAEQLREEITARQKAESERDELSATAARLEEENKELQSELEYLTLLTVRFEALVRRLWRQRGRLMTRLHSEVASQHFQARRRLLARRLFGWVLVLLLLATYAGTAHIWSKWSDLARVGLGIPLALGLPVGAFLIDGFLGFTSSLRQWWPWFACNLFFFVSGYLFLSFLGQNTLGVTCSTLATVASLIANPISGAYLPATNSRVASTPNNKAA